MTFWWFKWRSLNPWKGHLKHPKRSLGRSWNRVVDLALIHQSHQTPVNRQYLDPELVVPFFSGVFPNMFFRGEICNEKSCPSAKRVDPSCRSPQQLWYGKIPRDFLGKKWSPCHQKENNSPSNYSLIFQIPCEDRCFFKPQTPPEVKGL